MKTCTHNCLRFLSTPAMLVLCTLLSSCQQTARKNVAEKKPIDLWQVDHVYITNGMTYPDSTTLKGRLLTAEQAKLFATAWNTSICF